MNHILLGPGMVSPAEAYDILPRSDHPFREEETRRQIEVIARGSHGYGERLGSHLNEQRLLAYK